MDQQYIFLNNEGKCGYTNENGDEEMFLKLFTVVIFFILKKKYTVVKQDTS